MKLVKPKAFFLLFGFLFFSTLAFSQQGGVLKVYTIPQDAVIKIDSLKFTSGSSIKLDSGIYDIKIWAPDRELVTKTIKISDGFYKTISVELSVTREYKDYRRKLHYYNFSRFSLRYGPPIVYGVWSISKLIQNKALNEKADNYRRQALVSKAAYENSFWWFDFSINRSNFDMNKEKYGDAINSINRNRNFILIGAGATAVVTYFSWKKRKKLIKPEYEKDLKFSRLDVFPTFSSESSGLFVRFQF
jgi:hypothetical protein